MAISCDSSHDKKNILNFASTPINMNTDNVFITFPHCNSKEFQFSGTKLIKCWL